MIFRNSLEIQSAITRIRSRLAEYDEQEHLSPSDREDRAMLRGYLRSLEVSKCTPGESRCHANK